ncbi:enoyl-CoA hydratase/isomerase family protein [Microbacterium sp. GXS0129]|uniref:enoyl-CoA hydratase/isomerase family protein n=1 Tax=Microbacterium sp. GXS0129 TaxID=3377836 RepID=UPI003839F49F
MSDNMTDDVLLVSVEDGLARITLNRPTRLNAFDEALARRWEAVTAEVVARDDVLAILLDANGPAFCAGGDVAAMATGSGFGAGGIEALAHVINAGIRSLTESSIPVVVAAHGTTAGGGLGILLTGDYVVAGEGSRIGSIYANMGLTPDLSVTEALSRAIGERRALQLVLTDRLLTSAHALDWGLVAEVVADAEVKARAEEIARGWISGAARAYGQAKRLIRSRPTRTAVEQLAEEARTIGEAYGTDEAQARIQAFAAKSAAKTK